MTDPERSSDENPPREIIVSDTESLGITDQTIDQIKRALFDPESISEKYGTEGRKGVETEIAKVRTEAEAVNKRTAEKNKTFEERVQQLCELDDLKAEKVLTLEQHKKTRAARMKNFFGKVDKTAVSIETEISLLQNEIAAIEAQSSQLRQELRQVAQEQAKLPDSQKLLEAYYAKMETMPLSNEEKRELLKPEILAELSTEEYIALWRRLNPHFLSHVTRQGFRDHNATVYHSAGLQEFHDGFVSILQDGKLLRPPIAVRNGLRARDEASIREFLERWILQAEDKEEAERRLNVTIDSSLASAPKYPDTTAVHFAAQDVLDGTYGGEKSNEVFFLYPSDVLASQHDYTFNGSKKDFTQHQNDDMWNDVFIWPPTLDNPGISVDAGIVFLPENTPVDPETGSKYASEVKIIDGEEKRVMIEDEKLVSAFIEWAKNLNDESSVIQAYKEYDKEYVKKRSGAFADVKGKEMTFTDVTRQEMLQLGFCEEAANDLMQNISYNLQFFERNGDLSAYSLTPEEAARSILLSESANWKRAKNTITAKEYWERYFAQNPQLKPKHLVYYDGSPTTAILEWQQRNNIGRADVSETQGKLLGFDDHHVVDMQHDPRASRGYSEFSEIAHRIIAEHYGDEIE